MADRGIEQTFQEHPFARGLSEKTRSELARIAQDSTFPAGTVLFHEGERHALIYLVSSGNIALDMQVPGRGAVRILSLGAGDLLGWSPVVGDQLMTVTATALQETTAVALPGEQLRHLCEGDPEIGYHVMRAMTSILSRRLLATRLQLLDLFAETTPAAIAAPE